MKRILVYGMTDNPGGIESYLMFMMEKLKTYDIQMDFVTDFPTIAYKEQLEAAGAKIHFIPAKGKKLFKHMSSLKKILKSHPEYETVYFNILDAGAVFTAIVPKFMGRQVICHSHNGDTDKEKLHKLCKPLLTSITDKYVACSKLAAEYMFKKKVQDRVLIIPNAINVDNYRFDTASREHTRDILNVKDKFVVCHIGRITRQKNPYRMLDIFEEIYKLDKESVLLYVGNGDMSEEVNLEVKKRIEASNAEKKEPYIRMLGVRDDIPCILQAADVFLLPSLYEGLPIVAVEAQAAGLPIVMSTNITKEVALTDKVKYIDLEESDTYWANALLAIKNEPRTSGHKQVAEAGYDKNSMSAVFKEFTEWL
ncbi:MAG: glycosyltransferase family 1 protein [Lachnospiraceae bacterium]|nr:glycosyltransferase family 1 protein [Lachnospiraceae bacterium]